MGTRCVYDLYPSLWVISVTRIDLETYLGSRGDTIQGDAALYFLNFVIVMLLHIFLKKVKKFIFLESEFIQIIDLIHP